MDTFTTKTDCIVYVETALGDFVDDFDVQAIVDRIFEYRIDTNEHGDELLDTAGFYLIVNDDEFWDIAKSYDNTAH